MNPAIETATLAAPPESLTAGAVKGWHIALLFGLVWTSMAVVGAKFERHATVEWRAAGGPMVHLALTAVLVVLITLVVPELRRSFRGLYSNYRELPRASDATLFILVMLTWAFGLHRVVALYPLLAWHPEWAPVMGIHEHRGTVDLLSAFIAIATGAVVAPFAEELVFRGYLLNLWRRRWGLVPGIVLSCALFGIFHLQFVVMATVCGAFLALVYLRFGSLWPGTLLHGLYNLIALPLNQALFAEKHRSEMGTLSAWMPEVVLAACFFPVLWLFWRRFRPAP